MSTLNYQTNASASAFTHSAPSVCPPCSMNSTDAPWRWVAGVFGQNLCEALQCTRGAGLCSLGCMRAVSMDDVKAAWAKVNPSAKGGVANGGGLSAAALLGDTMAGFMPTIDQNNGEHSNRVAAFARHPIAFLLLHSSDAADAGDTERQVQHCHPAALWQQSGGG